MFALNRDDLLNTGGKKVWTNIINEIRVQPEEIDLLTHISNFNECVEDINTICVMIDIVLGEQSQSLLLDKCKKIQEISSDLCPGILIQPSNNSLEPYISQRGKLEQLFFPLRIMKHLEDVREKFIKGYS